MATIRNIKPDFADLELSISDATDGDVLTVSDAFKELNYSDNVDRELLRGANRVADDATEGEYSAEGSIIFHQKLFRYVNDWCKEKGYGFYNVEFNLTVNIRHKGRPIQVDTIKKVMFASRDSSNSQGPSPLEISCDLFIKDRIYFDGLGPFGEIL
jgi:hypothetical protein